MVHLHRRQALAAAGVGGAMPLLAACGDDASTMGGPGGAAPESTRDAGPSRSPSPPAESSSAAASTSAPAADVLTPTADVPVGGGRVIADEQVVVTQPRAGDFRAFSSICTHRGCPVTDVSGGTINCRCHGSAFSIRDGSVEQGPATAGLDAVQVVVSGGSVSRG